MTASPDELTKYHGSFPRLSVKLKTWPIIGFDTEDDSKGTPILFAFYGDFPKKKFVTKHFKKAIDFIYSLDKPAIIVCHNLEYDIANLFKGDDYLMIDEMTYASKLLKVTLYGTKTFFINSSCLFAGPLKKMAQFVGVEKLEGDPFSRNYILRDAEIPYLFTKQFQDRVTSEMRINLGITVGQMAMQSYRRNHMTKDRQVTYNSPNVLRAYYGGRVEIFYKGIARDVVCMDINSSYPNVMKNEVYPDTSRIVSASIDTHEFGIGHFRVHVPENTFIPVLPYKSKEGRLFFPTGTFDGWWTYAEMRYAISHGAKILKEFHGEGTDAGARPFESFIDEYYEKRLVCKRKMKTDPDNVQLKFDDLLFKLWQNNLYGKWCQWRPGTTMTRDKWPEWKLEKLRKNPEFKEIKIGPFYSYTIPKIEPPKTANFLWGVYVTSYARMNLHRGLVSIHDAGHTVLYSDTDSIMFQKKNDNIPLPVSNRLGDWDTEHFDLGIFRQAKGYLLCNRAGRDFEIVKCASKGVPTHFAHDFIIDGMVSEIKNKKPMRLKEALIRLNADVNADNPELLSEIGENVWRGVRKEMRSVYIKRKGKIGVTYPVNVDEIPALEKTTSQTPYSIENELRKNNIQIKKPVHSSAFENTVIPAGYFDGQPKRDVRPQLFLSRKIFHLRKTQCLELDPPAIWFAGHCLQVRRNRAGRRYYHFFLTNFKGMETPLNLWGVIPVKFFDDYGITENLLQKFVAISLDKKYIQKSSLSLRLNFSPSKFTGQIEAEEIEEEELTQKQVQKLLSQDWSQVEWLKKNQQIQMAIG